MKLLFIHDHPFYQEKDSTYSGGGLPYNVWNNYLINFKQIIVYGRLSNNLNDKKVISSTDNVSFYLTDKYTSVLNFIKNKKAIEKELESLVKEADVILTRLPSVLGFIAGSVALKENKILWVEQVGNAQEALSSHGSLLGKISASFFDGINKKIVKKANFVSYVTESKLQKDYPANTNAVTVALSDVIINTILGENELDKERFFSDVLRVGLIGGFDAKYKGQDILLNALSILDEDIKKNIKISFIGKGDYSWIISLAENLNLKENINFIGPLEPGEQVNEFLKTLSLYVQPSLTEGMPRATIEAMAMGCPVIGSNVGGIPDIVSERFVHNKGNAKELAEHINYLYTNREALNQEAILSLKNATPYLKENLDLKRLEFYTKMNKLLKK
jgi:glycosyltransferase involved in cell wall biosynthesis